MEKSKRREYIFEKAHLRESSDLARQYFIDSGLKIESIMLEQCKDLAKYIQKEIDELLLDKSYNMIKDLKIHPKIITNKSGIFLFTDSYYFKKRQAVSFEFSKDSYYKFIGFCGWASGCNKIKYIKGFVKWCDNISEKW